jgi:4-amino-4-deoxy-L-arabinose transferase-like glycosyltransferase
MKAAGLRAAASQGLSAVGARLREPAGRSHLRWSVAILVLALAARAFWVAYAPADPTDGRGMDDTIFYYGSAVGIANGEGYVNPWVSEPTAQWPPGYSFLLASVFRLPGPDVPAAWSLNVVVGALTCVALYWVGLLISGQKVGALAGLIMAVFPGHVFFSSLVMSETLFVFLVVVAMLMLALVAKRREPGVPLLLLTGAAVAAAAMVRGQGLFLFFVALLFWWVSSADWAHALQRATLVMVTAIALIIPWSVRNYVVTDGFVFISTNDGANLYMGNHEYANGRFMYAAGDWIARQFGDLSWPEGEVATSNAMLREGLRFMFTHPWREVQLAGSKIRALYEDDEDGLRWIHHPEVNSPVRSLKVISDIANAYYFAVIAAAGLGVWYWRRRPRDALSLPLLVIGVFTVGQLLFFGTPRFHLPMLPSFALLAAFGLTRGWEHLQRRRRRASKNA